MKKKLEFVVLGSGTSSDEQDIYLTFVHGSRSDAILSSLNYFSVFSLNERLLSTLGL